MSESFASGNVDAREDELVNRPTVGLVLSGGGARGAAHVGVIKVLDELQIPAPFAGRAMISVFWWTSIWVSINLA